MVEDVKWQRRRQCRVNSGHQLDEMTAHHRGHPGQGRASRAQSQERLGQRAARDHQDHIDHAARRQKQRRCRGHARRRADAHGEEHRPPVVPRVRHARGVRGVLSHENRPDVRRARLRQHLHQAHKEAHVLVHLHDAALRGPPAAWLQGEDEKTRRQRRDEADFLPRPALLRRRGLRRGPARAPPPCEGQ